MQFISFIDFSIQLTLLKTMKWLH